MNNSKNNLTVFFLMLFSWMSTPGVVTSVPMLEVRSLRDTATNRMSLQKRGTEFSHLISSHQNLSVRADSGLEVYRSCSVPQSFALTFDDGPAEFSEELDNNLAASPGSKVSYFINGNNYGCIFSHADVLKKRFNEGHLIGSHAWSHPHLNQGTYEQISRQIELLDQAMIKILGVKPLFFRPPYGEYNDIVLQVLREKGYKGLILWSHDTRDTAVPPPSASEIIGDLQSLPEKTIALAHETRRFMVEEVVPGILPSLKSKNFKIIPVAECLELGSSPKDWYTFVQQPGSRDDSWTCSGTPGAGSFD